MLAPLKDPLVSVLYTLLGLLLAKWWFDGLIWPALVLLGLCLVFTLALSPAADSQIVVNPKRALRILEAYAWVNGLLAASAVCVTTLVMVTGNGLAGKEDPTMTLIKAVATALTTLIGGVFVATKDADDTVGKRIAKQFQEKFTMEGQEDDEGEESKVVLKKGSESILALFTRYAYGWTDWTEDNRRARIDSLATHLAGDLVPRAPQA